MSQIIFTRVKSLVIYIHYIHVHAQYCNATVYCMCVHVHIRTLCMEMHVPNNFIVFIGLYIWGKKTISIFLGVKIKCNIAAIKVKYNLILLTHAVCYEGIVHMDLPCQIYRAKVETRKYLNTASRCLTLEFCQDKY